MKIITPVFYKNFKCIASACPDSCCQGWEVDVDKSTLEYYKALTGGLHERIESVLDKDEFENDIFRLADKKRCPFLNCENLCDIHIAIGGEHTPYTCKTFPRFINDFGGTRELGISFSCPVASDMMWELEEDFSFSQELNSDLPALNDIDAELYFTLLSERKKAYEIILDKTKPFNVRMVALLESAKELQKKLDDYEEGSNEIDFISVFNNPEIINKEWEEKVCNARFDIAVINSKPCENIAMYFLFRYYMQAVYDKDVLSKAKMAAVGVLIPAFFGNDSWTIHLWSKETEHSDVNMDRYKKLLKSADCLCSENLIKYFK